VAFAFAMPRGSGKTALARCAALWAILYGYRPFVCVIDRLLTCPPRRRQAG